MKSINEFIKTLEKTFANAPALPKEWKELLVNIAPWLSLIGGVLGILFVVQAISILNTLSSMMFFGGFYNMGIPSMVNLLLIAIACVFEIMAFSKLKRRTYIGWTYLFYAETLTLVGMLITLQLAGLIIGGLIGYYLLFQVKSYYK